MLTPERAKALRGTATAAVALSTPLTVAPVLVLHILDRLDDQERQLEEARAELKAARAGRGRWPANRPLPLVDPHL